MDREHSPYDYSYVCEYLYRQIYFGIAAHIQMINIMRQSKKFHAALPFSTQVLLKSTNGTPFPLAPARGHPCMFEKTPVFILLLPTSDISGGITHAGLTFFHLVCCGDLCPIHAFTSLPISLQIQLTLKHFFMLGEYFTICAFHNSFNHSTVIDISESPGLPWWLRL